MHDYAGEWVHVAVTCKMKHVRFQISQSVLQLAKGHRTAGRGIVEGTGPDIAAQTSEALLDELPFPSIVKSRGVHRTGNDHQDP